MLTKLIPQRALIVPMLLALSMGLGWLLAGPLRRVPVRGLLERGLIYCLLGVVAFSWVGTILAALNLFRPWLVLAVLLGLAAAVNLFGARGATGDQRQEPATPAWAQVVTLALLALAGWLYARPAESFWVLDDSGVYTLGGIVLARTGSLFVRPDSFWEATPDFVRQFFYLDPMGVAARHFGPFFQWTQSDPTLEIGFLPLPKVWAALVTWLSSPEYATWAAPFFGLVATASFYALCRRLCGWAAAVSATLLLTVSLPQIWFARYPISEIHTQAILLGGLYLALVARRNAADPPLAHRLAAWSGLTLAALALLRFEAALLLLAIVALLLPAPNRGTSPQAGSRRTWLVTLALAGSYGVALSVGVARHYFFEQTLLTAPPLVVRLGVAGVLAAAVGGWLRYHRHRQSQAPFLDRLHGWRPLIVAAGWLLWAAVAIWHLSSRPWGDSLAGWLVQYWSRPATALSVVGAIWLAWREYRQREAPELVTLLGLAALLLLGFSVSPLVTPNHPWAIRRLVPVVMPALALGLGALLAEGVTRVRWLPRRSARGIAGWAAAWLAAGLLFFQAFAIGQRSYPFLFHRELAGLWGQLRSLADRIPNHAVLLFDNGPIGQRMPQVMELVFGYPSLSFYQTPSPEGASMVDQLIEGALSRQRPVLLVVVDGDLAWWPQKWHLANWGAGRIATSMVRYCVGRPPGPQDVVSRTITLDIYRILPAQTLAGGDAPLPFDVPIGPGSYPYLRDGFSYREYDPAGNPIRWTTGDGLILLPWPGANVETPADFCLLVEVSGGRWQGAAPPAFSVEAEGEALFVGSVPTGFEPETLVMPVLGLENRDDPHLEIRLTSDTWRPRDDPRELGILLYGVKLVPAEQCASGP